MPQDLGKVKKKGGRTSLRLKEVGPRLSLKLIKVEEDFCKGPVFYHAYIHKSEKEVFEMQKMHEDKLAQKERRRREQEENVKRKQKAKKRRRGDPRAEEGVEDVDGMNGKNEHGDEEKDDGKKDDGKGTMVRAAQLKKRRRKVSEGRTKGKR